GRASAGLVLGREVLDQHEELLQRLDVVLDERLPLLLPRGVERAQLLAGVAGEIRVDRCLDVTLEHVDRGPEHLGAGLDGQLLVAGLPGRDVDVADGGDDVERDEVIEDLLERIDRGLGLALIGHGLLLQKTQGYGALYPDVHRLWYVSAHVREPLPYRR